MVRNMEPSVVLGWLYLEYMIILSRFLISVGFKYQGATMTWSVGL